MKYLVLVICLMVCVFAADEPKKQIPIVSLENVVEHNGKFHYTFETGDGTKTQQEGVFKQVDSENAGESVSGSFSYQGDDGQPYSVSYTADERGYQPIGAHFPTSPPIPKEIARALEYLATLPPPREEKKELSKA